MKLCDCGKFEGPHRPWDRRAGNCYLCYLQATNPDYGGTPAPAPHPTPAPRPPCRLLGRRARDEAGKVRTRWCHTG